MTGRERIKEAFDHKETSRIPIDFGGTNVTSISAVAYSRLQEALGIKDKNPRIYDLGQLIALPDHKIAEILGTDLIEPAQGFMKNSNEWRKLTVPFDGKDYMIPAFIDDLVDLVIDENETLYIKDKDGKSLGKMPKSAVHFNQDYWPFGCSEKIPDYFNKDRFSKHQWAIPNIPNNLNIKTSEGSRIINSSMKRLYQETDYAIVYPAGGSTIILGSTLRGFDNFLCDIYQDKKGTLRLLNHLLEDHLDFIEKVILVVGEYVEAILFYDDFGYQEGTFIPVEIYRDIFKPIHKKMWDLVHEKSKCKVMLHCCGSINEFIPEFIDAGVEILNPVQINAKNMEPSKLKKEFGKHLTFWGGGCDTRILAHGSEMQVIEEVKENINDFSKDGGFVFAPILNITAETPARNILAMYKTAMEY